MNSDLPKNRMWIIGRRKGLPAFELWRRFYRGAQIEGSRASFSSLDRNYSTIRASEIEQILNVKPPPHFAVMGDDWTFNYGENGGRDFDKVMLEANADVLTVERMQAFVDGILAEHPAFVQAHLVDNNYELLQNMYDFIQFKAQGIPIDGLPLKSNGLPPPLEQQIIDTSQNPGRFKLHHGYVETSAAYMWFGNRFWQVTGVDPKVAQDRMPHGVTI